MSDETEFEIPQPSRFELIAGPCSAETREQILAVGAQLARMGVETLRAGVWKPRTRPGHFEGAGSEALSWLVEARETFGLRVATEVGTQRHVEECRDHQIDVIWIGARSTCSPFVVDELATALSGADVPILVKNPICPDLGLWVGALERLEQVASGRISAVHRGFSVTQRGRFRNAPEWSIPLELKKRCPTTPVLCDPSHIAGRADLVPEVTRTAVELGFSGLMVEVHSDPSRAWSDAEQQLTPGGLQELLASIRWPVPGRQTTSSQPRLDHLRFRIDEVDRAIVGRVAERMQIAIEIGQIKAESGIAVLQPDRWEGVLATAKGLATELSLDPGLVVRIFQLLHEQSIDVQVNQVPPGSNAQAPRSS